MLTTAEAFEKFRKRLELSDTERQDAAKRHTEVRDCIRGGFDIKNDFLSGSYRRHTKTKPLKDVDVMFVMGERENHRRSKPPIETLQAFEKCLKKQYTDVAIGRRSVTVEFAKNYYPDDDDEGKILSIDAVPAFECEGGDYEIPDKITGTWIKTNPEKNREQATNKNKDLDGHWVPLVKMAKAWNRASDKPIKPSFLIEVMAQELVEPPFSTFANEVRNFLAAMEANIGREWSDPAKLGPPVSDEMIRELVDKAKASLREEQRKAALAARAEETGRQSEALRLWREIVGDYFPLS